MELQVQRLMLRNQLSEADALARVHSQMPLERKKSLAEVVIDNSGSKENLHVNVRHRDWHLFIRECTAHVYGVHHVLC